MGSVIIDLSVSLDGFIAGPDDGAEFPLGRGGDALFAWGSAGPEGNAMGPWLRPPDASVVVVREWMTDCGAMISGRRTFDIANGWKGGDPIDAPIFVVTHSRRSAGSGARGSSSCPRASTAPSSWRSRRRAGAASRSAAPTWRSSCSGPGWSTRSRSASRRCCSAAASGCSVTCPGPVPLEQVRVLGSDGVSHLRYRVRH